MFLGDAQLQKEWITSQQPQEGPPRVLWLGCPWGRLASSCPSRGSTDSSWGWRVQASPGVQILGLSPYI